MKQFFRTVPGKTLLFFLACVFFIVGVVSTVATISILDGDGYTTSEEELIEMYAFENQFFSVERDDSEGYAEEMQFQLSDYKVDINGYQYPVKFLNLPKLSGMMILSWKNQYLYSLDSSGYLLQNPDGSWEEYHSYIDPEAVIQLKSMGKNIYSYQVNISELQDVYMGQVEVPYRRELIHIGYQLRYVFPVAAVGSALLLLICVIALMCVSGRRAGTEGLVPGPFNPVPSDLMAAGVAGVGILAIAWLDSLWWDGLEMVIAVSICMLVVFALVLGLAMSIACRIKERTLFSNTVCVRLWKQLCKWTKIFFRGLKKGMKKGTKGFFRILGALPFIWKTCLAVAGITLLEFIVLAGCWYEPDNLMIFWVLEKLLLIPLVLYAALMLRRLQQAGRALAEGDLTYQVDTKHMLWDLKQHGENLNSIAGGMTIAVNERMKSERMKTELITNVSHDIKTPLTSIINYVDLIGKEESGNPKIAEYAEVLSRQSGRLKRLIEDLVEASKASTGNLEVELFPCDAGIFLTQTAGEYEQKLTDAGLSLVTKVSETPQIVMADGRRMQRVFDNLMNNICKYAQPGTRVYMTLQRTDGQAVITFRNTSKEELNIAPEELMERFVRGDKARNSEGNGLGLSIARSLTELQGGSFRLEIDGDLFKVILTFPEVR